MTSFSSAIAIPRNGTYASEKGESFREWLMHHVTNSQSWNLPFASIDLSFLNFTLLGMDMTLSLHSLMLLIGTSVCMILFPLASRRKNLLPVSKFGHIIEAIAVFIRNDIIFPFLGRQNAAFWTPHILTLFFFLLTLNLLGLLPFMAAVTGNINFSITMAAIVFIVFNLAGIFRNGLSYFKNLVPAGVPPLILVILYPIEIMALFTKSSAMAIRMFANLSAGHFVIFSLLGLIHVFYKTLQSEFMALAVSPLPVAFAIFILAIEIFVAFLQAYVFTLLSTLFIGSALYQDH